jgi:surface-anchored protein
LHKLFLCLLIVFLLALANVAEAVTLKVATAGHCHAGAAYEAEEEGAQRGLHLHFASEGATIDGVVEGGPGYEVEFHPAEIEILLPATTRKWAPTGPAYTGWEALGVPAGGAFYRLSQSPTDCNAEGTVFFGLATEEIEAGVFEDDLLTFSLNGVPVSPPGGVVSVYRPPTVTGGLPTFYMTSVNGVFPNGGLPMDAGTHGHYNFAFSKPGLYQVEYTVSGRLVEGGATVSDSAAFNFHVVPEPGTLALLGGLGAVVAILAVLRRK